MNSRTQSAYRMLLARLRSSESGAVAPILGICLLVLIGCMGFAIDAGRSMVVKARLVDALDAAGLAVGARPNTSDYNADALRFVAANFKANYAAATVTSVTATPSSDKSVITLAATATMPTVFMRIFGSNTVTVNAATEITRASTGLELVMVLDNTGSMEMSGSMPGLKTAAQGLVDTMFAGKTTATDLYIGLVPFSQTVNIGTSRTGWVKATSLLPTTNPYYPSYWLGCVEARKNALEETDDPPTLGNYLFTAYYSPDTTNWSSLYKNEPDWNSNYININDWLTDSGVARSVYYNSYKSADQRGPGTYCPSAVTAMTNVKSKITTGISAMKAAGSTMINVGAVWGWRMLSPRWRGYWDGDMAANNLPLDYNTKNMSKAVVLMTDGDNSFGPYNYTAYGVLADMASDNRFNTKDQATAESKLDTKLTTVCNSMKAVGITVVTVAYNNPATATKSLLQSCASSGLYFDAANTTALNAAFQTIAGALSQLRVSK